MFLCVIAAPTALFVKIMKQVNITWTQNGLLVAYYEGFVGIGCLILGLFIEKVKYSHWILGFGILIGIGLSCSVYYITSYPVIIGVMVGFGITRSIGDCFLCMFIYRIYHLTGAMYLSLGYLITATCVALITYTIDYIAQITGSWNTLFYGIGIIGFLGSMITLILPTPQPPKVLKHIKDSINKSPKLTVMNSTLNDDLPIITSNQDSNTSLQNKYSTHLSNNPNSNILSAVEGFIENNGIPITSTTDMAATTLVGKQIDISIPTKSPLKRKSNLNEITSKLMEDMDENSVTPNIAKDLKHQHASKCYTTLFIISLMVNFVWYGLKMGFTSYIQLYFQYELKMSETKSLALVGVFWSGWSCGKLALIPGMKCFSAHIVNLICNTGILLTISGILYFYKINIISTEIPLYILLFFYGIFGSTVFILSTAFLNNIKPITGFITSMLCMICCVGAAICSWLFGFIVDYTNDYNWIIYLIAILSVIHQILALTLLVSYLMSKYVCKS